MKAYPRQPTGLAPGPSSKATPQARRRRVALLALAVLLIGAPQLYGGAFPWTIVAIACMALAALAATLWATRGESDVGIPWLALAVCAAAFWTLLQASPLPCVLVAWLAPDSAMELRNVLALIGSPAPSWCTLSRDVGATRLEVLKGVAITATFLSAWRLAVNGAREHVIWLGGWATLAMSGVAHLHMALNLDEVFGIYRPVHAGKGMQLAPLMNPNNLGGFVALGVPIWLGILQRAREPRDRAIAALAIVLIATTVLLTLSRGAIAMLFGSAGLMVFAVFARSRRPSRARRSRRSVPGAALGLTLALGIGVGVYLAADRVLLEFQRGGTDKLDLILASFGFAGQHPWLGVGRGAFGSTFVGVEGSLLYYRYAENFLAQWASEWGFPATLLLLAAVAHALWLAVAEAKSPIRVGAIVGVIGLAAQNLVDPGLELAGVVVVASALLAAAVAPSRRLRRVAQGASRLRLDRFSIGVALVSVIAVLWLGPTAEGDSTTRLESSLRAELEARNRGAFRALLERAVRMHPREPVFAVLAAGEALVHRDKRALRWINRGMQLAPGWAGPHVQAFQWLWLYGHREQALLEMRSAAEIEPNALRPFVCHVARTGSQPALRAAPRSEVPHRLEFLELAASCQDFGHPTSQELDAVLRREFPKHAPTRERGAMRLAKKGELDAALAELDALRRDEPGRTQTQTLRVLLPLQAKRYAEAAQTALAVAPLLEPREAAVVWKLRARALAELGDDAGWQTAIAALRRTVSDDITRLADTYAFQGDLHLRRGQLGAAMRAYREAFGINEDSRYLASYAGISKELGDRASAVWALMRLCELHPGEKNYCAERDALIAKDRGMNFGTGVRN